MNVFSYDTRTWVEKLLERWFPPSFGGKLEYVPFQQTMLDRHDVPWPTHLYTHQSPEVLKFGK